MNAAVLTNAFSASVTSLPVNQSRLMVFTPHRSWYPKVKERLEQLVRLEVGWDGYQAKPVTFENATFALRLLEAICGNEQAAPQLVPGYDGDLQIEWHTLLGDIELRVRSANNVHAWRSLVSAGEDGETAELTNDFALVASWLKQITEPTVAAGSAAA
jgi:hypothetical protein